MRSGQKIISAATIVLLLVSIVAAVGFADEDFANAAAIFELGTGARIDAMGGAFIGLADDQHSAVYNPAGLGLSDGGGLSTTYDRQFDALNYNSFVGALGPLGVAGMNLSSGSVNVTDQFGTDTGEVASYSSTGLIGSLGLSGRTFGLRTGPNRLSAGLQFLAFSSDLSDTTGEGYSLRLSSIYRRMIGRNSYFQIGAVFPGNFRLDSLVTDIPLGRITYEDSEGEVVHEEAFPDHLGVGIGVKIDGGGGRVSKFVLDWLERSGFRGGFESKLWFLSVRMGLAASGRVTTGAGLDLGELGPADFLDEARIDGAYVWQSGLGGSWSLSFSVGF